MDEASGQEFFVHESKVPAGMHIKAGDKVTFESNTDSQGRPSAVILPSDGASSSSSSRPVSTTSGQTTTMPCFTMSQPFAALLLNGIKTVESRNNPMFTKIKPGTRVLLHCGRRDWHDVESYRDILRQEMSEKEIDQVSRLPRGFGKGEIIGMITVGKTWRSSDAERRGEDLQRRVLAPFEGIGQYCTEITNSQWLTQSVKARGNPGVYQVDIPSNCLPTEDWK